MLHIHNGESSANTLKQSAIKGEQFAFRDALIAGPTPGGLTSEDWRRVRTQHLSDAYGVDSQECERDLLLQEKTLVSFPDHEEIVLWFEYDLFCQVNLIYLLDWFAQRSLGKTKLSLICIGEFPGKANFRGLGELTADQLASLFDSRHEVTTAEMALAAALQAGRLAGAVLDVFQQEPLPADHVFWRTPHLLITSHTAALSFPDSSNGWVVGRQGYVSHYHLVPAIQPR